MKTIVISKREFYRIILPSTYEDLDFNTLEEAQSCQARMLEDFRSEIYYDIEARKQCKIVKVTEIIEEV